VLPYVQQLISLSTKALSLYSAAQPQTSSAVGPATRLKRMQAARIAGWNGGFLAKEYQKIGFWWS